MRNRLNVIQINGIKGIIFVIFAAICLAAGFIAFPGMVLKSGWNFVANATSLIPTIGAIQGTLLWGIVVVSYFAFKKKGFFVELKSAEDLSKAEMDAVMHRIRTERQADIISKAVMRARAMDAQTRSEMDKFIKQQSSENVNDVSGVNQEKGEINQ